MVLKDLQCSRCDTVQESMIRTGDTQRRLYCESCLEHTKHYSICNGGLRSRFRYNDWTGYDATGAFVATGDVSVTEADGTPSLNTDGTPTQVSCKNKYNSEVRGERRERRTYDYKKRDGKLPMRFC